MYLPKETWLSIVEKEMALGKVPALPCPSCQKVLLEFKMDSVALFDVVKRSYPGIPKLDSTPQENFINALTYATESFSETKTKRFRFSAALVCRNCQETTVAAGDAKAHSAGGGPLYIHIRSTWPELQIFELKDAYPVSVTNELKKSFIPFFRDSTSAGSRVRTAIEILLDELKVPRERTREDGQVKRKQNGSPVMLSLGERLKELDNKDSYIAKLLGAIKQLGNEATHGGDLPYPDLLDAFDLMNHVLEELYVERPKRRTKIRTSDQIYKKYQ